MYRSFKLPELQEIRGRLPVGIHIVKDSVDVTSVFSFSFLNDVFTKLMNQIALWTMDLELAGVVLRI